MCGGSNLSTDLLLWGIYIKKYISLVRICLQTRNARNASTKFRKTLESKKAEKSLEISAFLVFSCLHLNQTLIMAGVAGFGPTRAGVKVPCLTAWLYPNKGGRWGSNPRVPEPQSGALTTSPHPPHYSKRCNSRYYSRFPIVWQVFFENNLCLCLLYIKTLKS